MDGNGEEPYTLTYAVSGAKKGIPAHDFVADDVTASQSKQRWMRNVNKLGVNDVTK